MDGCYVGGFSASGNLTVAKELVKIAQQLGGISSLHSFKRCKGILSGPQTLDMSSPFQHSLT